MLINKNKQKSTVSHMYFKVFKKQTTVKPVYNDHPRDRKFVAVVEGGHCSEVPLCYKK